MRQTILAGGSIVLLLIAGISNARAAEGEGHGTHAPPHPSAPPAVVHGTTDKGLHVDIHTPPRDIPHEGGVSIFGGTEHRPDGWRYRQENGVWWYWLNNHWSYWDNGQWQTYVAVGDAPVVAAPIPSDPNFYWYNNQWWYLRGDHWLIYDHDKWHDGPAGEHPPLREMGHGPVVRSPHEEMHTNEHDHK